MNALTSVNSYSAEAYLSPVTAPSQTKPSAASANSDPVPVDQVDITPTADALLRDASETGRIALNAAAGNLTGSQATQLYQQIASIQTQIGTDKQADGGSLSSQDAQTINQLQSQLSATIYSDAHNGAAPPSTPSTPIVAVQREALQAGRIQLNEQAGNLSASQAQQLMQQQSKIDGQIAADTNSLTGSLTPSQEQQINQLQDRASAQIRQTVHGPTPSS